MPKYKLACPVTDGGALVIGGRPRTRPAPARHHELFDSRTGRFSSGPTMAERGTRSPMRCPAADGRIAAARVRAERTPTAGSRSPAPQLRAAVPGRGALATARLLVTGGYDDRTRVTARRSSPSPDDAGGYSIKWARRGGTAARARAAGARRARPALRHFDAAEDAVQEPCSRLPAVARRRRTGRSEALLIRVASRRLIDQMRSEQSRREREVADALRTPELPPVGDSDDSQLVCCSCAAPRPRVALAGVAHSCAPSVASRPARSPTRFSSPNRPGPADHRPSNGSGRPACRSPCRTRERAARLDAVLRCSI